MNIRRSEDATLAQELESHNSQLEKQNEKLRRVQQELDSLYKSYRHKYEYAPVGYFVLDANDRSILQANFAAASLLGLELDQIVNTSFVNYLDPGFVDEYHLCTEKALKNFTPENCEVKLRDGERYVWIQMETKVVEGRQQVYVTAQDVTQQKILVASKQKKIEEITKKAHELSIQLLLVEEEERKKLANNIHDSVGQSLTLLIMQVDRLRRLPSHEIGPVLDDIDKQSSEIVQQIRDLATNLSMHMLRESGLSRALQDYIKKVEGTTSLKVNFRCNGLETRLNRILETSVFHIIQEAITNVLRHSNVNEADIVIEVADNVLNLRIKDEGCGFVPDSETLSSFGMKNMREKAEVLGATWMVESSPGKGTLLTGKFPLPS